MRVHTHTHTEIQTVHTYTHSFAINPFFIAPVCRCNFVFTSIICFKNVLNGNKGRVILSAYLCRPTPKVEWKKKDGSLDEASGEIDNHGRWLHFDSITQDDDGEYECRAFNSHGSTTHSFTVTVEGR